MQSFGSLYVGFRRLFNGAKKAKIVVNAICLYMCLPFFSNCVPRNTFASRFVCFENGKVFHVLRVSCFPQITPSVIRWVTVDVVNFIIRPFSGHHGPSNAVSLVTLMPYGNNYAPAWVDTPSHFPNHGFLTGSHFPVKFSCFWVIRKYLMEFFWRQHNRNLRFFWPLSTVNTIGGCHR